MVKLDRDDRRDLIKLLADMPQFADRQQRQVLLIDAGLDDLVSHMNLSAPSPSSAASEIVTYLSQYGQVDEDHEALGLLLSWIVEAELVGVKQQRFLNALIDRYQMFGKGSGVSQADAASVSDDSQPGAAVSYQTPEPPSQPGKAAAGSVGLTDEQRAQLLGVLNGIAFTLDNLEELCFLLNIDRENLRHDTKPHLARDLIRYCESLSMIDRLVAAVRRARPNVDLDLFKESTDKRQPLPGTGSPSGMGKSGTDIIQDGTTVQLALPPVFQLEQMEPSQDRAAVPARPHFNPDFFYLPDEPLLGFVEIPAGPFLMGSDPLKDKLALENEQPQHTVDLPAFWIARYPVTVAQFSSFVTATGYEPGDKYALSGELDHPVVWVTWTEALEYCTWLESMLLAHPLAERLRARLGHDLRVMLPSEAEWEKAARGVSGSIYPWGDDFDSHRTNTYESGIETTSAVGSYPYGASLYGVMDMSGNVWEWTRSLWGSSLDQPKWKYPYESKDRTREDLNASDKLYRVLRGGSWNDNDKHARCAFRFKNLPDVRYLSIGFRVMLLPSSSIL